MAKKVSSHSGLPIGKNETFDDGLARVMSEALEAVLIGAPMTEGRDHIKEWWKKQDPKERSDREKIRLLSDRMKQIGEALAQEIRTLSLENVG